MTNVEQANYGFSISSESGKSVFTYQQEKYKTKNLLPTIFILLILSLFPLIIIQPGSVFSGVAWWLAFILGSFSLLKYLMNLRRKEGSFSIDKDSFEVDGRRYLKKDVTSLYIKEGNSEPVANINMNNAPGAAIAFNANPAGLMAASAVNAAHGIARIGDAAGAKFRQNIARLNCKIFIRYGNKNVVLVKGITLNTAEVMLDKIVEVSQLPGSY